MTHIHPNPEYTFPSVTQPDIIEKPHQFQVFEDPEYVDSRYMITEVHEHNDA